VSVPLADLGHPAIATGVLRLRLTGVPESARQRLIAVGAEIVEADEDGDLHAEIISTRLSPDEVSEVTRRLPTTPHPVVVLAHTGAERLAAELVGGGAIGLVGEGNEEALLGLVEDERTPGSLLASFERRFGDGGASDGRGRDPVTGLPDRRSFERRIGTLGDAGEIPRVVFLRVVSDRWNVAAPDPVIGLQRRRLASAMTHLIGASGAELYSTGNGEFGMVGADLSPNAVEAIGGRLVEVARTFSDRGLPLRLVLGHAGPESSTDPEELVDLARRALDVASMDGTRNVLGGEQLALGVSVTTELEASLKLVAAVEDLLPEGKGHGERVGRIAAELARTLGWSPAAVARMQLAGHLHDVGRAGLPDEVVAGPEGLSGDVLELWRTFPARSAQALRLTAGPVVAASVKGQCERWDGDGFPEGRRATEIPEGARVLAVAHAVETLTLADRTANSVILGERLRERAGTELEPELVVTAVAAMPALVAAGRTSA
jgi:HD-GYP domain-containing protein (c-di-GMP phosphodiesterase class II)